MNTLLVSYDLRAPGKDYSSLWDHLKSYPGYIKPLESFWIIRTFSTCDKVRDAAKACVDSNDKLIVIDITKDNAA